MKRQKKEKKKICKWNNSFVEKRNKIQYQTLFTLFDGCVGNPSMVYHQPNEEKGDEQKNTPWHDTNKMFCHNMSTSFSKHWTFLEIIFYEFVFFLGDTDLFFARIASHFKY